MTNKTFVLINYKMLPAYGFHIDFEFWVETTWLSGSQMAQTPKGLKSGSALSWVDQSEIFHFHTGFYVYDQLWKVVDLEYQQYREKKNHPTTYESFNVL